LVTFFVYFQLEIDRTHVRQSICWSFLSSSIIQKKKIWKAGVFSLFILWHTEKICISVKRKKYIYGERDGITQIK